MNKIGQMVIVMVFLLWMLPIDAWAVLHPQQGRFMQRDLLGYVDGGSLYQYERSNAVRYVDPSGLWLAGDHEKFTEHQVEAAIETGSLSPNAKCKNWVIKKLTAGNADQDDVFNNLHDLSRHYNSPNAAGKEAADGAYATYLGQEASKYNTALAKVSDAKGWKKNQACGDALKSLGHLYHSYQDFYAHAILRTGSFTAWSATPPVTGSPDDRSSFWPSTYPGEHPGIGEPTSGAEFDARKKAAQEYSDQKAITGLKGWWDKCGCNCGD